MLIPMQSLRTTKRTSNRMATGLPSAYSSRSLMSSLSSVFTNSIKLRSKLCGELLVWMSSCIICAVSVLAAVCTDYGHIVRTLLKPPQEYYWCFSIHLRSKAVFSTGLVIIDFTTSFLILLSTLTRSTEDSSSPTLDGFCSRRTKHFRLKDKSWMSRISSQTQSSLSKRNIT